MRLEGGPRPAASMRSSVRTETPITAAACVRFSNRSVVSVSSSTITSARLLRAGIGARWSGLVYSMVSTLTAIARQTRLLQNAAIEKVKRLDDGLAAGTEPSLRQGRPVQGPWRSRGAGERSKLRIASKRRSNAHAAIWRVAFVLKCNDVERNLWLLSALFN